MNKKQITMKKIVIVFAFALLASFTYTAVAAVKTNSTAVEKFDDDPKKKSEAKEDTQKDKTKKDCTAEQKSKCCSKKKSSCTKK